MVKFFIDGVDLRKALVTQNDRGRYYYNGRSYWRTTIDKFDDATPPTGYKTYNNGSHKYSQITKPFYTHPTPAPEHLLQLAYDYKGTGSSNITADKPVKMLQNNGEFVKIQYGVYSFWIGHLEAGKSPANGTIISAGKRIGNLKDYNAHLHIYALKNGKQYPMRNIILQEEDMEKGTKMKYTVKTNLRSTPGLTSKVIGVLQPGAVGEIIDGPKTVGNYKWYFLRLADISGWCIGGSETPLEVTKIDGSVVGVCEDRIKELLSHLKDAETVIASKDSDITGLEEQIAQQQVVFKKTMEKVHELTAEVDGLTRDKEVFSEKIGHQSAEINILQNKIQALKDKGLDGLSCQDKVKVLLSEAIKCFQKWLSNNSE